MSSHEHVEVDRLRVPLHFVCPDRAVWAELAASAAPAAIAPARLAGLSVTPVDCWILRTFYELRGRGSNVTLGSRTRAACVNIAHVFDFGRRQRLNTHFVVTTQGDGYRSALGSYNIRQNGLEPADATQDWLPHWLQPGLRPRDPIRGSALRTAAYRGHPLNLIGGLRDPEFAAALARRGVTFDPGVAQDGTPSAWEDYSNVDVLVALRDVTQADLHNKPASKLVNAWAAGVPAILGPEPAYQELRRSDLDFIEARTAAQVIDAVDTLRADPAKYDAMVQNGLKRADAFAPDRLTDRWVALLNGPVARAFTAWNRRGRLTRGTSVVRMLCAERGRKVRYRHDRDHGHRPLAQRRTAAAHAPVAATPGAVPVSFTDPITSAGAPTR